MNRAIASIGAWSLVGCTYDWSVPTPRHDSGVLDGAAVGDDSSLDAKASHDDSGEVELDIADSEEDARTSDGDADRPGGDVPDGGFDEPREAGPPPDGSPASPISCGDGWCDLATESTTSCAADCGAACFSESLLGLWRGEGDPADALHRLDGTLGDGAVLGAGWHGLGFRFPTAGSYLSIPDLAGATADPQGGDFSIELWATISGDATLVSKGCSGCSSGAGYSLRVIDGSTRILFTTKAQTGPRFDCGAYPGHAIDDQWHHYAATLDRDGLAVLYLDGTRVGSCDARDAAGVIESETACFIGVFERGDVSSHVNRVDELALYATPLTDAQVAAIAAAPGGKCAR